MSARFARGSAVGHQVLRAGPMPPGNLPAAARDARYRLMAEWARGARVAALLLGHTMEDQAETLLMRLGRGSGVEGLSGMAPRHDRAGIAWLRPMLGVRRDALRDWLRGQGIAWVDDPTNEDPAYDRVKARRALAVLEPLGLTVEGLAETAARLARQRRVLMRAAAETAAAALSQGTFGEARLALAPLRATERDTALRVFAETLVRVGGRSYRPRFRSVEPALARLLDGRDGAAITLGGCLVVPELDGEMSDGPDGSDGGAVLICREPAAVAGPRPLVPPGVVWDGRWRVAVPRGVAELNAGGLHVGALGAAGCDRLGREAWAVPPEWSAAPRPVRQTVPAVFAAADCQAGSLLAVPLAGYLAEGAPAALAGIEAAPVRPADAAP